MKHIVVTGPTASGKTDLALALAQKLGAAIISADSRQVYQKLTAGTAKPEGKWQNGAYRVNGAVYHLVDFLPPDKTFNAASFCLQAEQLTRQTPDTPFIFAGGTGMYLHAFFVGLDPLPPADPSLRAQLSAFASAHGKKALHARLQDKDPVSAEQIPAGNIQRVMRALEITLLAGRPASELRKGAFLGQFPAEKAFLVYLNWDQGLLNARIEKRTRNILEPMAAETRALLADGIPVDCPALKSLGYPQILQYINGQISKEEAFEKIVILTRQYAKRQRTWFNRYKNVLRLDLTDAQDFDTQKLTEYIIRAYTAAS